jgi:predicted GIY-YIG superfamily endonuclease
MNDYHCVYTLQSLSQPNQIYTGQTENLQNRLNDHNAGKVPHTSKFRPWVIRSATAFKDKSRAMAYERYSKTGSGRAFLHRHL